jgi:hypothetical protein
MALAKEEMGQGLLVAGSPMPMRVLRPPRGNIFPVRVHLKEPDFRSSNYSSGPRRTLFVQIRIIEAG